MFEATIPGRLPVAPGVGVPAKLIKHDRRAYKGIAVPKGAVPQALLKAGKVLLILGVPQQGVTIAVEARPWVEKVSLVYFITRKPYSEYLTKLAEQGIREVVLYQIVPVGEGRT